ncbi:MAG: hypothetical protein K1X53_11280 [Candidatus Sumerlaeaceae bacterium]|nr:hypothetical protein [Candidatus Sumerlaeaceae bacterium]
MEITANYNPPDSGPAARKFLALGVIGLIVFGIGYTVNKTQFYNSYLLAYIFWTNMALGALMLTMLQHLTGGAWGVVSRRILESATRTLWVMVPLILPILFGGMHSLYEWTHTDVVKADPILIAKAPYLNETFFIIRTVAYFVLWLGLITLLNRWSAQQDKSLESAVPATKSMRWISGPGLIVYALTMTFASVDWMMSLDPHWYSTMYPVIFVVGQVLGTFTLLIITMVWLSGREPMSKYITKAHIHDLGKLMLAFVMLWAYVSFSQFLIMWQGNVAEETPWYMIRKKDGWQYLAIVLFVFHFALPFLLLLSRDLKKNVRKLAAVAGLLMFMRYVDLFWLLRPRNEWMFEKAAEAHDKSGHVFGPHLTHSFTWMDFAALIGFGGVWLGFFLLELKKRPLLPVNDPNFEEALNHVGH